MKENITEKVIIPVNPSSKKFVKNKYKIPNKDKYIVQNKDKYNLYAPMGGIDKVGMAGFSSEDFNVNEKNIVSIKKSYIKTVNNISGDENRNITLKTDNISDVDQENKYMTQTEKDTWSSTTQLALETSQRAEETADRAEGTADRAEGAADRAEDTADTAYNIAIGIDDKATEALNTANTSDLKSTEALNKATVAEESSTTNRDNLQTLITNLGNGAFEVAKALEAKDYNINTGSIKEKFSELLNSINDLVVIVNGLKGATVSLGQIGISTENITQQILDNYVISLGKTNQQGYVIYDLNDNEWEYNEESWVNNGKFINTPATNEQQGTVIGNEYISILAGVMTVLKSDDALKLGGELPEYYAAVEMLSELSDRIEEVAGSIPANVNRYFTAQTETIFDKQYYLMQNDKPINTIQNINQNIIATNAANANIIGRFTMGQGVIEAVNFPLQSTSVSLQALRTAGSQTIYLFVKGYHLKPNGDEVLLATSQHATITNNEKTYTFFLPLPEYVAEVGSRAIIEVLAFRDSGAGTHTARLLVDNDTMSRWSYTVSLNDVKHNATNILTSHDNNTLTNGDKNAQADIDELDNKINKAVLFTDQTLTEEQKLQARQNIGAGESGFSGSYDDLVGEPDLTIYETVSGNNSKLALKLDKKPNGTMDLLDGNNKINTVYVPDYLLGQMLYGGSVSDATATLSSNAKTKLGTTSATITLTNNTTAITGYKANEGIYYLASAVGTFADITFAVGDWLISTGAGWSKIDNTDAVTGIKGDSESTYRIGNVNITKANIGLGNAEDTADLDKPINTATQTALNLKATKLNIAQDQVPRKTGAGTGEPNSGISYTTSATASTLMCRDADGRVRIVAGTEDTHAVNKSQLDTKDVQPYSQHSTGVGNGYRLVAKFDYSASPTGDTRKVFRFKVKQGHGNGTSYVFWGDYIVGLGTLNQITCSGLLSKSDGTFGKCGYRLDAANHTIYFYIHTGQYSAYFTSDITSLTPGTTGVVTWYSESGLTTDTVTEGINSYYPIASGRLAIESQIPTVPTNYVTTNTEQTGLSGNKAWIGTHTFGTINASEINLIT